MTVFSDRLRALRIEAGLSQKELAGDILTAGYISLLESGKRTPSDEAVQWLARRLGCSTTMLITGEPSEREQRIELEQAYARLAIEHGESAEAKTRLAKLLAEEGLALRVRDDLSLLYGIACERSGDLRAAVGVLQELADRSAAGRTHLPVTFIAITLVHCYLESGDLNQAVHVGESALAAAEAQHLDDTGDYFRLAATVMDAHMGLGDFLRARMWADRYLCHALDRDQPIGQAALYWNAAILAEHEGRLGEALALCERALALFGELGTVRDTPRLQVEMAWLLLLDDPPQVQRAADLLRLATDALEDLGSRVDRSRWSRLWAVTMLHQGDVEAAETKARQAVELVGTNAPLDRAHALLALADVMAAQGRADEATELLLGAHAALVHVPRGRATSMTWRDVATRLAILGRFDEAWQAFEHALDGAGVRDRSSALIDRVRELSVRATNNLAEHR